MSDENASAGARGGRTDYDEMIEQLDVAIEEAVRKIDSGRVYDAENERVRQGWIHALARAMDVRRKISQDRDLEELWEEIEALKERQERAKYR